MTITANNDTKVYGTLKTFSSMAFTQTGLVSGDTITGVTETSTGAAASAAVGTYAILPGAATGTGLSNYNIHYVSGTLTVVPALTVPAAQTAYENVSQALSGISIGSGLSGSLTLTLAVGHGTLTLGSTSGLTVTGNGSGSVILTGSTANINAALATLAYQGSHNYSGADTLSLTLSAGGLSSQASEAISVVSIAQQDANLQAQVSALRTAGVLNKGQATMLISDLNLKGTRGDVGKVQQFLADVTSLLKAGVLTQAQANALLGPGKILLQGLTVEFGG